MRILGIDPGSRRLGYGVIELDGSQVHYCGSGCLLPKGELLDRLRQIDEGMTQILHQYQPQEAAIESIFVQRFAKSALILGHARGVAMAAVARFGLPLEEYAPRLVKQAIVGKGAANKDQVQHMVKHLLSLQGALQEDAADALAIALSHARLRSHQQAKVIKV